jgi:hypothetical protein
MRYQRIGQHVRSPGDSRESERFVFSKDRRKVESGGYREAIMSSFKIRGLAFRYDDLFLDGLILKMQTPPSSARS